MGYFYFSYTRIMNEIKVEELKLRKVLIPSALGSDAAGEIAAPKNGAYRDTLVEYEQNGNLYIYTSEGVYTKVKKGNE